MPASELISPDPLHVMARRFWEDKAFLTAVELDMFSAIGSERCTGEQIAQRLGTDQGATEKLLNALTAMKLLEKSNNQYKNTQLTLLYLDVQSEHYLGTALKHNAHLWYSWSNLTDIVRTGQRQRDDKKSKKNTAELEAFIGAMHANGMVRAPDVVNTLNLDDVKNILDVGGGSGAYAIAFAEQLPHAQVTVFDLPDVVPLTRTYVADAGLSRRITVRMGDYNEDTFGTGFDLVFVSSIIHSLNDKSNQVLIKKCAAALRKNGLIVIRDFFMDENKSGPLFSTLFALNMLVATEQGDTYTPVEVTSWLHNAGFTHVEILDPPDANARLITGRWGS